MAETMKLPVAQLKKGPWLLAISGGPDSMALFGMARASGILFACAFVNYHTRKESDLEENYVRSICQQYQIQCHVLNAPFISHHNFEADARAWRYDFFKELIKENHYLGVMTGHQEDDLLETYLMQKEKNIVPEYYGLKERMDYHGILIERPLLKYSKKELQEYCDRSGIQYWIDSTNLTNDHARNKVRHEIIEHLSEKERAALLLEIEKANKNIKRIRTQAKSLFVEDGVSLQEYRNETEDVRLAAIRDLVKPASEVNPSKKHLLSIDKILMRKNDFVIAYENARIIQENGIAALGKIEKPYRCECNEIKDFETRYFAVRQKGKSTEAVSLEKNDFPITIRNFQDGDVIHMFYGHKNVARFFVDRHIPLFLRDTWPVVENKDGKIILVPGLGCDRSHYCPEKSVYVVQLLALKESLYVGK